MSNKPRPVYCPELDKEFTSINSCAKKLGISTPNLRKVLSGARKTCSGYHFQFVEDEAKGVSQNGDNEDNKLPEANIQPTV